MAAVMGVMVVAAIRVVLLVVLVGGAGIGLLVGVRPVMGV